VKLDNKMKQLLREMGEAINESLSASDDLSLTIDRIRREGYDIFLILEATIGLNPRAGDGEGSAENTLPASSIEISDVSDGEPRDISPDERDREVVFQVSPDDEQFLRSLRISVDESAGGPGNDEGPATEADEEDET
jgi:hypothetical protein